MQAKLIPEVWAQEFLQHHSEKRNLKKLFSIIEEKVTDDFPSLFVLPELFLSGYNVKELAYTVAETIPGPSTEEIILFLEDKGYTNVFIALGMIELSRSKRGILYNSLAIISSKGVLGVFRKKHLPTFGVFDEYRYYKPDDPKVPKLVKIIDFKAGGMICYDTFFPETARALTLAGADLIIVPSAAPTVSMPFWDSLLKARAIENTVYIVYVNTVGYMDGLNFFGKSRIIDPLGNVVAMGAEFKEDIITAEIELDTIIKARRVRPVLKDLSVNDFMELEDAFDKFLKLY